MATERPSALDPTQADQAALLRPTGNGPTADDEQQLFEDAFGPADEHGVYAAPTAEGGEQ